jgi:hypothetical protein
VGGLVATATQLRNKALYKLGVFGTGQTASSQKQADLDASYTEVYAELSSRSLTTWDSDEDIPDEYVNPVVALMADSRKDEYSIPNDRYQRITIDARGDGTPRNPGAIANIKTVQASNVYETPKSDYF